MKKAIFLDKDGTLVENVAYNVRLDRIRVLPGVFEALDRLQSAGYALIIVTNQAGIAHGMFSVEEFQDSMMYLLQQFKRHDIYITDYYFCPHHPEGVMKRFQSSCLCRKPLPGMIQTAIVDHRINPRQSWMVGDILHDVEAGNRAGCSTLLVDTGNETLWDQTIDERVPLASMPSLLDAAKYIVPAPYASFYQGGFL